MQSTWTDQNDRPRGRLAPFLIGAVLLHLAALPYLSPALLRPHGLEIKQRKIELVAMSHRVTRHHDRRSTSTAQLQRRPLPPPTPEPEKKKDESKLSGPVVDIPPTPNSTPPKNARFLSEHNTNVERETRSRHYQKDYQNAMNELTVARKGELASPATPQEATALEIGPQRPSAARARDQAGDGSVFMLPKLKQRDRLALRVDPEDGRFRNQSDSDALDGNSDRLKLALGTGRGQNEAPGSAPHQAPTVADLVPSVGVLARLNGAPANDVPLDMVDEGEGTFLNSREFKYASFFNRLKRGVSQHWNPLAEYRRRDPTGNIYGFRTRVTVLNVTLNSNGSLKNVDVAQSSGVDFLDREAVTAFRSAEPFPNPPRGLVDTDGFITFPFGFHVEFTQHSGLGLF